MTAAEVLLFHAHGLGVVRVEPCACGGRIEADALDRGTWPSAVAAHQRTERHRRWRAWCIDDEIPQGGCTPTAGPERVDLSAVPPVRFGARPAAGRVTHAAP